MAAAAIGLSLMQRSSRRKKKKKAISGSSRRSSTVEKTVYLRANATEGMDWYVINLSSKDCSKRRKEKTGRVGSKEQEPLYIEPILRNILLPWNGCFVALGSTIYCTSASAEYFSSDVVAWDTTNTIGEGEPVPAMNLQRRACLSEVITADGKIYVFGGVDRYRNDEPIDDLVKFVCEVFDPSTNKWESINHPSPEQLFTFLENSDYDLFAVYDEFESRIILGSRLNEDGFLLTYGVRDATWRTITTKFMRSSNHVNFSRPAFFDRTLYWIEIHAYSILDCGLYAYDLDLQMLIQGTIMGVHPYFWGSNTSSMQFLHFRGDEFYLIWFEQYDRVVRCERVRISKRIDTRKQEGSVTAYVISTKTYLLDTQPHSDIGAVVL